MDLVQRQWKILRNQFTREHRFQNFHMYEPSGTGNNTKRPRKIWYLYQSFLFLAPHVAHRSISSNFVRERTMITQTSPSISQIALEPTGQSTSEMYNLSNSDLFSNDLNVSTPLPERSMSSASSASSTNSRSLNFTRKNLLSPPYDQSATRKIKKSRKEQ